MHGELSVVYGEGKRNKKVSWPLKTIVMASARQKVKHSAKKILNIIGKNHLKGTCRK